MRVGPAGTPLRQPASQNPDPRERTSPHDRGVRVRFPPGCVRMPSRGSISTASSLAGPRRCRWPGIRTRLAEEMEALFPGSSQAQRRFPVEVTGLGTDGKAAGLGATTVRGWEVEHACGAAAGAASGTGRHQLGLFRGHGVDSGAGRSSARTDLFAVEACTLDRPVRYHLDYQTLRAHLGGDPRPADRAHPYVRCHHQTHRRRPARRLRRNDRRPVTLPALAGPQPKRRRPV
jgi:hypothetical protein